MSEYFRGIDTYERYGIAETHKREDFDTNWQYDPYTDTWEDMEHDDRDYQERW